MRLSATRSVGNYRLTDLVSGLSEADALRVSARLILALANDIGDEQAIREAIALANDNT